MKQSLESQPTQPANQRTPSHLQSKSENRGGSQSNSHSAILRTQELIEQIKSAILTSIRDREQYVHEQDEQQSSMLNNPHNDNAEISFQPHSQDARQLGVALESNDLQA